ncbi:ABC transporter permease [Sphingomonas sp.]|uniref:ABC transporter permease n=1 Tax=Sphingomonas sp. TaxID=28214 RepID=UPI001B151781|nr:ABC transporter permease [Sphingomonas sp.]MBO9714509.1 ABC transporter permease [Sphingomonas sp.]
MSNFLRFLRQTLTIARRDFTSTVFTPMFLLFLLTPVLMIGFGIVGGLAGQSAATSGEANKRLVVIASPRDAMIIAETDRQLRLIFPSGDAPPILRIDSPGANVSAQAHGLFGKDKHEVSAVLYGPLEQPVILRTPRAGADVRYLTQLAEQSQRARKLGSTARQSAPEIQVVQQGSASASGRAGIAYFGVIGIFVLTLMLSSQAVGTMAEERSNKVIEVLAAAVPLESVFLGKLIGMFGSAVLFILFWGTMIANLPRLLPPEFASGLSNLTPAIGVPAFPLLFVAYFTMSYMLLGAVFLSLGALASTPREIQLLGLPMTVFQFALFGLSTYSITHEGTWGSIAAKVLPFSSPSAMVGFAANSDSIWPHVAALGWQALWVGIVVSLGARTFRRGVLKSESPKLWRRRQAAAQLT